MPAGLSGPINFRIDRELSLACARVLLRTSCLEPKRVDAGDYHHLFDVLIFLAIVLSLLAGIQVAGENIEAPGPRDVHEERELFVGAPGRDLRLEQIVLPALR